MVALATAAAACGGPPGGERERLEGPALVAGTSLPRLGLLVIPSGGGPAEFRSLEAPSTIRWTGRIALPPTTEAYSLGTVAVLRGADGAVRRYAPSPEAMTALGSVGAEARWMGSDDGGAFVTDREALVVTPGGARVVRAEGRRLLWAAPASGERVVGLLETSSGAELAIWDPEAERPAHTGPVPSRGPALLTGWGRQVVLPAEDDRVLASWSIPDLEPGPTASIGAPVVALAASPSQHRIYAGSSARPRLVSLDRYEWESLRSSRMDRPLQALRPAVTGERLLAFDGVSVWSLDPRDMERTAIPGAWRHDLPLALPGGDVLSLTGDGLRRFAADGTDLGAVEGPTEAWWLPLRWGPRAPVGPMAVAPDDTAERAEPLPTSEHRVGLLTVGGVSGRTVDAPPPRRPRETGAFDVGGGGAASGPADVVPDGFYAVAISSRRLDSARQLRRSLDASGYPTRLLPRIDEANETWYRLMVGPYPSREAAEAVAGELQRERGIDAWIQEISGGTTALPQRSE